VLGNEADHLLPEVVAVHGPDVQAIEEGLGGRDTLFLVIQRANAAVDHRGCRRFPKS
jgi:hypothetical protein